ncbi:DUF4349 domain-containing protein [Sphaerisporangium fuscum]|uniref:DUF4349 domain-containing protein n=1 Tax=Sphaerisporangium fuscum TaxID=2835868 RepID=UPI001BDCBE48|nr:DUF4349 domain-containing protein [Sphaerisporangium fuscum]
MSRSRCGPPLAAALAAVVLVVSGCAGGAVKTEGSAAGAPAPLRDEGAVPSPQNGDTVPMRSPGGLSKVRIRQPERAIIYTGDMTVRAKSVAAAADRAKQIVTGAGGRLDHEESASGSGEESATLVFKIPPDRYPAVLDQLGKVLGKREALQQGTEDVTEKVADVESRLKSARSSLDQLRALLGKAKTIGEVLSIEREISSREADLESLEARQKVLAAQTAAATLTLRLVGPAAVLPETDDEPSGFLGGLKTGWHALVTSVKVAVTGAGVLLPWAIPLALMVLAFRLLRRRTRRTTTTVPRPPAAPQPPATGEPASQAPERPAPAASED